MSLPNRKYYLIKDAANKISCTENDLIHYLANGDLDACVYFNMLSDPNGKMFHLNMPDDKSVEIDFLSVIHGGNWSIHDIKLSDGPPDEVICGYYAAAIDGFFYVDNYYLTALEFGDESVKIRMVSTCSGTDDELPIEVNLNGDGVVIDKDRLCIMHGDIEDFINKSDSGESNKTVAKKSELIKSLITLIPDFYGEDIEKYPVSKIKDILEAAASKRGMEFPKTDIGTLSKYLERGRHKK